ncbi:hypothetical protein B7P43_G05293 [Cryptotermes secundus]|uniref:Reverse transcriptase domain-containing protein n=1 Tax=Cryptotermes secundus TaxID=105785 RepID=A0A2J7R645_9NEOP|nr:hypothetical protein B7P43_G05293 [Cryptotermes secundus]
MKLNISKTKVISFSRKTKALIYDYKLCQLSIARTDSIKDLGVFIDAKLYFHDQVDRIQQRFAALCLIVSILKSITVILLLWRS